MEKIKNNRIEIDAIDSQIMKLLSKRFEITDEVMKYKLENKKQLLDLERENKILSMASKYDKKVFEVYEKILDLSKSFEREKYELFNNDNK